MRHGSGTGQGDQLEKIARLVQRRSKLTEEEVALLHWMFPEILAAHGDTVRGKLRRRGLSDAEAEEIFQEAFLGLFAYIVGQGFPDDVEAWLRSCAWRRFLNVVRDRRRSRESPGLPSSGSEKPPSAPDIDRVLDLHDVAQHLFTLLPPEQYDVIEAVVLSGLTHREAAEVLDVPEGTVKSRLVLAKAALLAHAEPLLPPSQRGAR